MGLLVTFFLVSIIFSFLCSIWEAVLLSITPAHAEIKLKEGGRVGQLLKEFKTNIDRPLSAILTLNTIAHTVGAIGVGAQASTIWPDDIGGIHISESIHISNSAIVGVVMTLAILILSEIIPKTLGANMWRELTNFTVISLDIVGKILFPFVWMSQQITKLLKKDKDKSVLSRNDFTVMAEIGAEQGVFRKDESKIIKNLLRFNTIRAKDIMTPRTVVKAANQETTIRDFFDAHKPLRFSRIPLYKESKDNINGFFLKDEMLSAIIHDKGDQPLETILRKIMVITEVTKLPDLFDQLIQGKENIALVVDEFGGMSGLVTTEDVVETLLGLEIVDEFDNITDMQALARKNWEKRAKMLGLLDEENK
ncbi:MAG: hemolysin family protein [Bacteroidota bacterium]